MISKENGMIYEPSYSTRHDETHAFLAWVLDGECLVVSGSVTETMWLFRFYKKAY